MNNGRAIMRSNQKSARADHVYLMCGFRAKESSFATETVASRTCVAVVSIAAGSVFTAALLFVLVFFGAKESPFLTDTFVSGSGVVVVLIAAGLVSAAAFLGLPLFFFFCAKELPFASGVAVVSIAAGLVSAATFLGLPLLAFFGAKESPFASGVVVVSIAAGLVSAAAFLLILVHFGAKEYPCVTETFASGPGVAEGSSMVDGFESTARVVPSVIDTFLSLPACVLHLHSAGRLPTHRLHHRSTFGALPQLARENHLLSWAYPNFLRVRLLHHVAPPRFP